jgi:Rhs element Vgr protein
MATVNPGDIVTLAGVGDRYNGNVFVTGVRHDNDLGRGWKTHVQFGSVERWMGDHHGVSAPRAAALLPGIAGLQIGVVTSNEDPDGEHRVRVRLPLVDGSGDGVWARVAALDAGADRGTFFRPELGDEVVVGFLDGDPRRAVMLGMLNSSAKAAPLTGSDDNNEKVFQSRSKMKIYFNDDTKVMRLETPAGNKLTLSEADKGIKLEDQNGNVIEMSGSGIRIESKTDLTLSAQQNAELSSELVTTVKGKLQLKLN